MDSLFREVRRRDRVLDEGPAWELLRRGEYGFLAVCGANGYGYGIPLSYALEGKSIYFHCAPEGFKLESIARNDRVSFCVAGPTRVIPDQFTTAYESVLAFGRIVSVRSEGERAEALRLLAGKYCPGFEEKARTYIARSFSRTHVLRLDIEHLSGKCKRLPGQ